MLPRLPVAWNKNRNRVCLNMLALDFFSDFVRLLLAIETDGHIEDSQPKRWAFRIHNYFIFYYCLTILQHIEFINLQHNTSHEGHLRSSARFASDTPGTTQHSQKPNRTTKRTQVRDNATHKKSDTILIFNRRLYTLRESQS